MRQALIAGVVLLAGSASAQQPAQGQGTLRQIIPGHYVYSTTTFNSGVIVTSEGAVVLDALASDAVARTARDTIAKTTGQPVRVLVSSTHHNQYSKGNTAYADVLRIGHENYRMDLLALMQREKISPEEQQARLPAVTYRNRLTLNLGGKEIQVLHVGRAHTRGDSIIFVPQDRIVYVSELLFVNQFLFINDGYGLDWLKALDAVEALEADIVIAGHGPIPADPRATREDLRKFRQMLVDVRDAVRNEIARGASEDQAVSALQWPQYARLQGYDAQRETAIRRLYRQLTGALP
jgi:cyclase